MRTHLALALALATLGAAPALAAPAQANPVFEDTGSERLPDFAALPAVPVTTGGILPTDGGEGIVQSANSLPPGFTQGTAPQVSAAITARYFARLAREAQPRLAQR
jgi:hypothetical protein